MKRKWISLLLAIVFVFSSLQIIVAEEPSNDVKYEVDPMEQISEEYTDFDPEYPDEYPHTEEASHTDRHSDGIYGLVISPSQAYLLVGDTLQLTAELLTEPPAEEETHFDGSEEADDQTTAQHTDTEISEEPTSETIDDEQLAETTSDLTDDQTEAEVERNEETETSTENVTENPTEESTIFTTTELEEGGEREVVTEAATDILEEESTTLAEAEPEAVSASRLPADPDELMWNSSNEEVAVIGAGGVVTAMSLGSTVITAYTADERFSAVCEISVVEELPVEEEPSDPRLIFGRVVILPSNDLSDIPTHYAVKIASTADVDFDVYKCDSNGNHTGNEVSNQINWTSSDTSIATVDSSGHVRGISNGSVTISVKAKLGIITVHNPIHVTVYTGYSTSHTGLAKAWVNQYKSTVTDCHDDRFVKKISPATKLSIYGYSGGYSYASIYGQSNDNKHSFFMWTQNLYDQTTGGSITICRNSDSDTRRHWDMYTTQTLYLRLTNNASCSWSTSNASVVKINNAASYTGAVATINPVAEGTAYITAQQGSKIDVIHVTTITQMATVRGVTSNWCGKYKCSHLDCTIIDRKDGDTAPEQLVNIYGKSGGFYYANVQGESTYRYMWMGNVLDHSWIRKCNIQNDFTVMVNGQQQTHRYIPQGFTVDSEYAYSIGIYGNDHKIFQYNFEDNELTEMQPVGSVGNLYHANDAAVVCFNENGHSQKYLFVAAFENETTSEIVKLKINTDDTYQEVARYSVNYPVPGISLVSGGGDSSAKFLLKSYYKFYEIDIANDRPNNQNIVLPSDPKFSITSNYSEYDHINTHQGIFYEKNSHKLYLPFSGGENYPNTSVVRCYNINNNNNNNNNNTNNIPYEDQTFVFAQNSYFEIENVGFRPNSTDNRLWFNTYENTVNSGIYADAYVTR